MRPPVTISRGAAANLISNAQVTGARSAHWTVRRRRRSLLKGIQFLVGEEKAVVTGPLQALRDLSGDCLSPIGTTEVGGDHARPYLDTFLRCRRCDACLKHRARLWSARAKVEIEAHERTWLVTLTCATQVHFRLLCLAEQAARSKGVNPSEWGPREEFAERWGQLGKEVTKWLKRVRATGARFTYLQVVEAHKSGLPHVHLLVHDKGDTTYRRLTDTWPLGFAHAKLVEGTAASRYVAKYLAKSALARVRASQGYGSTQINALFAKGLQARERF